MSRIKYCVHAPIACGNYGYGACSNCTLPHLYYLKKNAEKNKAMGEMSMPMKRKEELLLACSMLIEYLEPMVCNQDECDDCSFCAGDVIYTLEELKSEIMKSRRFNDDNT